MKTQGLITINYSLFREQNKLVTSLVNEWNFVNAKDNIDSKRTKLKVLVYEWKCPRQGRFFDKTLQSSLNKGGWWSRWVGVIALQNLLEQQAKNGRADLHLPVVEKQRKRVKLLGE